MTTPKRAAIYARISADDETVDKPAQQVAACRVLAEREGYTVVGVYDDGTVSAYKGVARPEYLRLSAAVQAGEVDVILASEQTRLARRDVERAALQSLCQKHGVAWHFASSGQYLDLAKPQDALNAGLVGLFAVYESDLKKMRLAARYAAERAKGRPLWGPRPFAYEIDRMTIREDEAEHLRAAYSQVLAGVSLSEIARQWRESGVRSPTSQARDQKKSVKRAGGREYSASTLRTLLLRVRNKGILEMGKGAERIEMPAAWPGIVTVETFDSVVELLTDPGRKTQKGNKKKYLSAGLVLCACGLPLRTKSANGEPYAQCVPTYASGEDRKSRGDVHTSMPMHAADEFVKKSLVRAICESPLPDEDGAGNSERRNALRLGAARLRKVQADLVAQVRKGIAVEVITAELAQLDREISKLDAEREQLDAARQSSMRDLRSDWIEPDPETGRLTISWEGAATLADAVRAKLDALSVKDQTELAREYLVVRLAPGRGKDRLSVEYLKSPHLNADEMDAAELADAAFDADEERRARRAASIHRSVIGYTDALPSRVTFLPSGRVSKTAPPAQSENF